jgi:hypothetical protein
MRNMLNEECAWHFYSSLERITEIFEMLPQVYGGVVFFNGVNGFRKEGTKLSSTGDQDVITSNRMNLSKIWELWYWCLAIKGLQKKLILIERLYNWFWRKIWGWKKFGLRLCPRTSLKTNCWGGGKFSLIFCKESMRVTNGWTVITWEKSRTF